MVRKLRHIVAVFCIVMISGLASANCGTCGGEKHEHKACSADCEKACCAEKESKCCGEDGKCCKKACPADCEKPCCTAQKAPDFKLKDINGKTVQLSKLKGKTVVLEWTNYDCPFVKYIYTPEKQTTGKLAKKYADKGVVWLTINSTNGTTVETNKEWASKHNVKHAVLVDSKGKVGKLYKAKTTPHVYVIDKKGKIAYQGALDNAPLGKVAEGEEKINYVDKALSEVLAGKQVTTVKTKPYGCSVKYPKKS